MGLNYVLSTAASAAHPPGQMDEHGKEQPLETHLIWCPYTYYGQEKDVVAYCDELRMCLRGRTRTKGEIYAACGWNVVLIEKLAPLIRTTLECKKACLVTSTTTNNTPSRKWKSFRTGHRWPPDDDAPNPLMKKIKTETWCNSLSINMAHANIHTRDGFKRVDN